MATTLRTIFLILLFAFITQMQYNLDADKTATRQIKNGLELAVHDASLAVSSTDLANGKVIFNQNTAIANLKKSLETNLHVTSGAGYVFKPTDQSFFKNDLNIVDLEFIDDSVTTTYPYIYKNPKYNIIEKVDGPCILAVMTTNSPRWFNGDGTTIRQAAVYEYKKD